MSLNLALPELKLAPQVTLQLWDQDQIGSDDFVAELKIDLNRFKDSIIPPGEVRCRCKCLSFRIAHAAVSQFPPVPTPEWMALGKVGHPELGQFGELLLGFQVRFVAGSALCLNLSTVPRFNSCSRRNSRRTHFLHLAALRPHSSRSGKGFRLAVFVVPPPFPRVQVPGSDRAGDEVPRPVRFR